MDQSVFGIPRKHQCPSIHCATWVALHRAPAASSTRLQLPSSTEAWPHEAACSTSSSIDSRNVSLAKPISGSASAVQAGHRQRRRSPRAHSAAHRQSEALKCAAIHHGSRDPEADALALVLLLEVAFEREDAIVGAAVLLAAPNAQSCFVVRRLGWDSRRGIGAR